MPFNQTPPILAALALVTMEIGTQCHFQYPERPLDSRLPRSQALLHLREEHANPS
jgi:hypothetical protein